MRSALILLASVASLAISPAQARAQSDDQPIGDHRMGSDREDRSTLGEARERGGGRDEGMRRPERRNDDGQGRHEGMRAMEMRTDRVAAEARTPQMAPPPSAMGGSGWQSARVHGGERADRNWNGQARGWRDGPRSDGRGERDWAGQREGSRDGIRAPERGDEALTARSGERRVERDGVRPRIAPLEGELSARSGERWSGHHDRDRHDWSRDWRSDHRYDWRRYRDSNRSRFRIGIYYDPYGWNYRRWDVGYSLFPRYYSSSFWLDDPWQYRLPPAYGPYRWVRYYDDALLVNIYTGRVVDVIHHFFW